MEFIEIPPTEKCPQKEGAPLLIFSHGRLSNERDLLDLAPSFTSRFRVVSVRAPIRMGIDAYGWFHSTFEPRYAAVQPLELYEAKSQIIRLILSLQVKYRVTHGQIFLLGFSQGAVMSLGVALERPELFGGVVAFNGCLLHQFVPKKVPSLPALSQLPLFISHGIHDDVLPIQYGRDTREALAQLPVQLVYREYPTGHTIDEVNFPEARDWLMGLRTGSGLLRAKFPYPGDPDGNEGRGDKHNCQKPEREPEES